MDTREQKDGGEGGIRTLDTRLTYTPLAGERLQPLGHFSEFFLDNARTERHAKDLLPLLRGERG